MQTYKYLFHYRINILVIIFLVSTTNQNLVNGQEEYSILIDLRNNNYEKIIKKLKDKPTLNSEMIMWRLNFQKRFNVNDKNFLSIENYDFPLNNKFNQFLYYLNCGDYYFYKFPNRILEAQKQYLEALKLSEKERSKILICFSLKKILELHRSDYLTGNQLNEEYIKKYKENSFDNIEKYTAYYYELMLKFQHNNGHILDEEMIVELVNFTKNSSNNYLNAMIFQLYGSYQDFKENQLKAIEYENKALLELANINYNYKSTLVKRSLINKARYFLNIDNDSVRVNLKRIDTFNRNRIEDTYSKYFYLINSISMSKDLYYKEAYENLVKYNIVLEQDMLNKKELEFKESEIKYQTAEKEKTILEQENEILKEQANRKSAEAKNKQSQTIAFGLGGTLLLGSIIAFLVYRNTKRKQHIAEQDRELQIQKTETILKEKEIETINAMVSGQEKERLRLAGELHDNLGSTLATVRMQVENLERNLDKVEDPKELLKKTNALVNEAYDKVRKISHERNSGVMAKDGLLPAVQKLARTVSNANNLTVDVQDFGLENRIANELEITIFRIIQELVTNIVKHAKATEANISLTQHDNELNIMVEDNGKGFKVGKLKEKEGMGLGNIERRIEHLEGSMEVDSTPGRGTSISIDIPL